MVMAEPSSLRGIRVEPISAWRRSDDQQQSSGSVARTQCDTPCQSQLKRMCCCLTDSRSANSSWSTRYPLP
jgi:hypothetical protein